MLPLLAAVASAYPISRGLLAEVHLPRALVLFVVILLGITIAREHELAWIAHVENVQAARAEEAKADALLALTLPPAMVARLKVGGWGFCLTCSSFFFPFLSFGRLATRPQCSPLGSFLPSPLFSNPQGSGRSDARFATMHSDVSVLFVEICRFGELSTMMHSTELLAMLNIAFSAFDECVQDSGAYKVRPQRGPLYAASALPPDGHRRPALYPSVSLFLSSLFK